MSKYDEIDQLLVESDAFVAVGQGEATVAAAESKLDVSFPPSFREYLRTWRNLSFGGYEYYGLTRNGDFDNSGVPKLRVVHLAEKGCRRQFAVTFVDYLQEEFVQYIKGA